MVENQNHRMVAGETKRITVVCTDALGAATDFTSATGSWVVKRYVNGVLTTSISKTLVSGITASGGTLTITLATGDTTSMSGLYSHELRCTLANGDVITFLTGSLTVLPTIA